MSNQIPDRYIQFCKDAAALALKYDLDSLGVKFTPSYLQNDWRDDIEMNWAAGRHGADSCHLTIASTVRVREKIEWPKEPTE